MDSAINVGFKYVFSSLICVRVAILPLALIQVPISATLQSVSAMPRQSSMGM